MGTGKPRSTSRPTEPHAQQHGDTLPITPLGIHCITSGWRKPFCSKVGIYILNKKMKPHFKTKLLHNGKQSKHAIYKTSQRILTLTFLFSKHFFFFFFFLEIHSEFLFARHGAALRAPLGPPITPSHQQRSQFGHSILSPSFLSPQNVPIQHSLPRQL